MYLWIKEINNSLSTYILHTIMGSLHKLFVIFTIVLRPGLKYMFCWGKWASSWSCNLFRLPSPRAKVDFWEGPAKLTLGQIYLGAWLIISTHTLTYLKWSHVFSPKRFWARGPWARLKMGKVRTDKEEQRDARRDKMMGIDPAFPFYTMSISSLSF